ncbi:hypothetical protein [Streptomyces albipurpureus]|uniref:Uncharacterized protein n=1 Tax=Streptomyces albipurpureus TaxID=2897419 RepID=A0ABT0USB9_9ACTN|nr:hypothetical protein [Streptomyces sp. CWNU-1]MCM2390520.1 hypothetical protein [Streptomyces sp. CWNU-1]
MRHQKAGATLKSTVGVISEPLRDRKNRVGPHTADVFSNLTPPLPAAVSASHAVVRDDNG